jgi:uncharacterized paraquat-inducible protein A
MLPWLLAVLLTAGVVGLAVVPWLRAVPDPDASPAPWSEAMVERELARRYCLECGQRVEAEDAGRCPACGAPRPEVGA